MRYRTLSPTGDYTFGAGSAGFLVNSPEAVAQAVQTRLRLATGEWFLDRTEGTPYSTDILGKGTLDLYDQAIKDRIINTPGVLSIDNYASLLDEQRNLTVTCLLTTLYGAVQITQVL